MTNREAHSGRPRVVITGWGAVTPLGLTVDETWAALVAGRSGIGDVTSFDADDLSHRIAGEVDGFDPDRYVPRKISRRMDPFAQYAVGAATQAVRAADLDLGDELAPRLGVLVGTGYGPVSTIHALVTKLAESGPRSISPYAQVSTAVDSAAGEISMLFGARGPSRAISTACASGTDAIGEAVRWIQRGEVAAVLTGGAEHMLTRLDFASSGNARALSARNDDPRRASRPFDEDRNGFVPGAGAGILVLEEARRAVHRGAPILAEVLGYGSSSDAHHWTAPHPENTGVRQAMRAAIGDAGIEPTEIDYINAHGTSTPLNDAQETAAIRAELGEHATTIPVSSTKSMTGHMIGAAGAVELIASCCALRSGLVPPTVNCDRPLDEEMNYVAHTAQRTDPRVAMSNSFGFGGHNGVLVVRRWSDES